LRRSIGQRLELLESRQLQRLAPHEFWRAMIPGDLDGEAMRSTYRALLPAWPALSRNPPDAQALPPPQD
jgi:hypothetical protein